MIMEPHFDNNECERAPTALGSGQSLDVPCPCNKLQESSPVPEAHCPLSLVGAITPASGFSLFNQLSNLQLGPVPELHDPLSASASLGTRNANNPLVPLMIGYRVPQDLRSRRSSGNKVRSFASGTRRVSHPNLTDRC